MNANLPTADPCALRTGQVTSNFTVKTTLRRTAPRKNLVRLILALAILFGLTTSRIAQAQNLNLGLYDNYLTLTDQNTHKNTAAYLAVSQDKYGNLTGAMYINSTSYQVTGTLTWAGIYWPNWYWLDITATYTSPWWFHSSTQFHLSDWVYDQGYGSVQFYTGNYTWTSSAGFYWANGGGTFSGYGFIPPH